MKISIALVAVMLTGCSSQPRFETIIQKDGEIDAFDRKTGQLCRPQAKTLPVTSEEEEVYERVFMPELHRAAVQPADPATMARAAEIKRKLYPPLPYCVDLK
jgi:hypothetical protein